jgi:hypothetical protein
MATEGATKWRSRSRANGPRSARAGLDGIAPPGLGLGGDRIDEHAHRRRHELALRVHQHELRLRAEHPLEKGGGGVHRVGAPRSGRCHRRGSLAQFITSLGREA